MLKTFQSKMRKRQKYWADALQAEAFYNIDLDPNLGLGLVSRPDR